MAVERLLLDTNILLAATDPARAEHDRALAAYNTHWPQAGTALYTCGQVLREYLVVATRPTDVNGLGLDVASALRNVDQLAARMRFLEETVHSSRRLRELLRSHSVQGKRIHDANLVAIMLTSGVESIVTQNPSDFRPFKDVVTTREL